jgi:hypothetical protein
MGEFSIRSILRGIVTHGMEGFERAREDLGISDKFDVMAMIAIGKRGPKQKSSSKASRKGISK